MSPQLLTASVIFLLTYFVLAIGRMPGFRIDRTGAAIIGAAAMIGARVLTVDEAWRSIDYNTILLLFGMMIVVANLRLSGFFALLSSRLLEHLHRPVALLAAVVFASGFFSAFFVNDTICLVLTPLVIEVTAAAGLNPLPYLLAVATASNIGSVATITGNPQNMIIGSLSGIPYRVFAGALSPVAALGLLVCFALIWLRYRRDLRPRPVLVAPPQVHIHKALLWKSAAVSALMIVFFFVGWPVATVAFLAGSLMLITRRVNPRKIYHEIDWPLLVLFTGLFITVAGMEKAAVQAGLLRETSRLSLWHMPVLSGVTLVLSNIVGNVPAVLILKPIVAHLPDPRHAWLFVAMASTLAGNLTLVGSMANLIVVQRARHANIDISFWEYLRVGAPLCLLTLLLGILSLN